ncbi:MAG TPA: WhiB family transcriptional regulator [Dermatophilaceae bacterium]
MTARPRALDPGRPPCTDDPRAFFDPQRYAQALAMCSRCRLLVSCRALADRGDEQHGVWAGTVRDPANHGQQAQRDVPDSPHRRK